MIKTHGIFINYKRTHKHLAGRIYDYFKGKGILPFMDDYSMFQKDYRETLIEQVTDTPYFLCLLTEDGVEELTKNPTDEAIYFREIKTACEKNKKILVLVYGNVNYDTLCNLPPEIEKIKYINHYRIPEESRFFYSVMDELYTNDIDESILHGSLDWRDISVHKSNIWLASRTEMEKGTASFENRFGRDFVDCIRNKRKFKGEYRIKEINMVCYAANIILCKSSNYLDRMAYDYGMMFNIFAGLLADPDFSFRLVINAPQSLASIDAINYSKLGNSSLEDNEELVFLSSYANINSMKNLEPYKSAFLNKRFRFMVTDCVMPYALFQIIYKDGYQEFNHIKIDLYSCNLDSAVERRCMMIFQKDDPDNYSFFEKQIKFFNSKASKKRSDSLIRENHEQWLAAWDESKDDE